MDEVADELYGLEPSEFVAIRTERVKAARAAGDRTLARQIAGLRRPTTVAWMVNIFSRERSEDVESLLELGEALRDAQRHLAGDELRTLTTRRQQVVRAMAKAAGALAAERGYQVSETALREIGQSLHAALADPDIAELVRSGRLLSAVSYSGMGPAGLTLVGGTERKSPSRGSRARATDDEVAAVRAELVDAEHAEREAESADQAANDQAQQATESRSAASQRVEVLREQLTQAEQELQFARRAEQAATGAAANSRRELDHARARVSGLRKKLETMVGEGSRPSR